MTDSLLWFLYLLTGLTSDCTSLSGFLQIISTKEIMAFQVCLYYCFIPTEHDTSQKQQTLPLPYSSFPSTGPLLPLQNLQTRFWSEWTYSISHSQPLCNISLLREYICPACLAGKATFRPSLQVLHCFLVLWRQSPYSLWAILLALTGILWQAEGLVKMYF